MAGIRHHREFQENRIMKLYGYFRSSAAYRVRIALLELAPFQAAAPERQPDAE